MCVFPTNTSINKKGGEDETIGACCSLSSSVFMCMGAVYVRLSVPIGNTCCLLAMGAEMQFPSTCCWAAGFSNISQVLLWNFLVWNPCLLVHLLCWIQAISKTFINLCACLPSMLNVLLWCCSWQSYQSEEPNTSELRNYRNGLRGSLSIDQNNVYR